MSQRLLQRWFAPLAALAGLGVLGLVGLWAWLSTPSPPLHPSPEHVPSVTGTAPLARWTAAAEDARAAVRAALLEQNLPGVSVAVGRGDEVVWAEGFGWADLETRARVTPDTQFRIGTASVMLTSAAVGLLLEQGRLRLDDEIQTYVPEFPPKPWPVTLGALMGHTAGLRTDGGDEGPLFGERCGRPVDALPHFADRELLFEPGTKQRDSSYGWILVSAAVEAAAKTPFQRVMRKQVFEPLGMDDTRAESAGEMAPDQAISYFPRLSADPRYGADVMRALDYSCYAGASGFLSTPSDLVRFGLAMHGDRLLRPETIARLQTTGHLRSGEATGYGLGWDLDTVTLAGQPTAVAGHDGFLLGGKTSSLLASRERDLVVAVIANESYADTSALARRVADAFTRR